MTPTFRALLVCFPLVVVALPVRGQEKLLTRCVEVQALPREKAAQGLPVAVRGVVTLAFSGERTGFVVDDGRGVFVAWLDATQGAQRPTETHGQDRFEAGTLVEIRGVTGRGRFAAVIVPHEIKAVGTAPLPPFRPMTVSAMRSGSMDCQCVELSGVVQRAVARQEGDPNSESQLEVVAPDGRFVVVVWGRTAEELEALVDAEVRVRGVATTFFNARGESMGIRLQARERDAVEVTRAAPSDPFTAPPTTTRALYRFSLAPMNLHRQRLQGTVTLSRPGEFFYLESEERAVRVNTNSPVPPRVGERVEAAGFVEMVRYFAEVRDAVWRGLGSAPVPAPLRTDVPELLAGMTRDTLIESDLLDGRLVQLRGRLLKVDVGTGKMEHRLLLDCHGRIVLALLGGETPGAQLARFMPGSELEVTGIAVLSLGANWPAMLFAEARDLQLLLRDAADLRVLRAPSWWTPERLWRLLGATVTVLLAALAWATLLRRRVAERGAQLAAEMQARTAAEIEHAATQRERTRLAADLHDTIEQALTGLAFQLEAARRFALSLGERSTQHFELSRQLLASSREELRRAVWNLRAQGLEGRSFIDALRASAESAAAGREVEIIVEETGGPKAVPEFTAGNLLLLAQEAMTNALKHASPKRIAVRVAHEPGQIAMTIADDGAGFDPAHSPGLANGHFGLQGMRERVDRLDGTIKIESAPGRGARIAVRVPSSVAEPGA